MQNILELLCGLFVNYELEDVLIRICNAMSIEPARILKIED